MYYPYPSWGGHGYYQPYYNPYYNNYFNPYFRHHFPMRHWGWGFRRGWW